MPTRSSAFRTLLAGSLAFGLLGGSTRISRLEDDPTIYVQPLEGEMPSYYSNYNSSWVPLHRYDDFVAPQTGTLTQLTFWGKGWNFLQDDDCSLDGKVSNFIIDFYTWQTSILCEWTPVTLIQRFVIPRSSVTKVFENPTGKLQYRYTLTLPDGFDIVEDEKYGMLVMAVLNDHSDPCVFVWSSASTVTGGAAWWLDTTNETCTPSGSDQAFALYMAICVGDTDDNGEVGVNDLLG
ncbi:MAG: hypothetical protein O7G85_03915, partial [Planctomycetota bacterium]|nr:hypothetical protein [Planctomycetota bacterium]